MANWNNEQAKQFCLSCSCVHRAQSPDGRRVRLRRSSCHNILECLGLCISVCRHPAVGMCSHDASCLAWFYCRCRYIASGIMEDADVPSTVLRIIRTLFILPFVRRLSHFCACRVELRPQLDYTANRCFDCSFPSLSDQPIGFLERFCRRRR